MVAVHARQETTLQGLQHLAPGLERRIRGYGMFKRLDVQKFTTLSHSSAALHADARGALVRGRAGTAAGTDAPLDRRGGALGAKGC